MSKGTTLLIALLALSSKGVSAQESPDPSQVYVEGLEYQGSGCPPNSTVQNLSPDREAMTLLFDSYIVNSGEVAGKIAQKDCRVKLSLHVPEGWSFAVFGADVRGYAALGEGVRGVQDTRYDFGAGAPVRLSPLRLTGPTNEDYIHIAKLPLDPLNFSQCQAQRHVLRLETSIKVEGDQPFRNGAAPSQGLMTVDSLDGEVENHYTLVWKSCRSPTVEARCLVEGVSRRGVRHEFWGVAFGRNAQMASAKAIATARRRCRRVEENNHRVQMRCAPQPGQCTTNSH